MSRRKPTDPEQPEGIGKVPLGMAVIALLVTALCLWLGYVLS